MTAHSLKQSSVRFGIAAFGRIRRQVQSATHPLNRLAARLPLSLIVAGTGLLPLCFAATTRPDAPLGAFIYGY